MTNLLRVSVLAAASLFIVALPVAPAAMAESDEQTRAATCLPHGEIEDTLRLNYREERVGHEVSGDGTLVEVFMSSAGTFTVIKTKPSGVSCVVDFGEGWQSIAPLESASLKQLAPVVRASAR